MRACVYLCVCVFERESVCICVGEGLRPEGDWTGEGRRVRERERGCKQALSS